MKELTGIKIIYVPKFSRLILAADKVQVIGVLYKNRIIIKSKCYAVDMRKLKWQWNKLSGFKMLVIYSTQWWFITFPSQSIHFLSFKTIFNISYYVLLLTMFNFKIIQVFFIQGLSSVRDAVQTKKNKYGIIFHDLLDFSFTFFFLYDGVSLFHYIHYLFQLWCDCFQIFKILLRRI